jgi:signal transduction histidine kinase
LLTILVSFVDFFKRYNQIVLITTSAVVGLGIVAMIACANTELEEKLQECTGNEPSSGLRLLLCKDFVEKHGGKIWVEREEGKGSAFCFTLPF